MTTVTAPACTAGSTALGYLLHALGATETYYYYAPDLGLPSSTICLDGHAMIVSVTRARPPLFRAVVDEIAAYQRYDVVLLRLDAIEEDAIHVSADVTLGLLPCAPLSMRDLVLWADTDDRLWLVPEGDSASIAIGVDGCNLELFTPYNTSAERSTAVRRAAAQMVRACRPEGAR